MPFQQITGCWSLHKKQHVHMWSPHRLSEKSLGYFFHERAAADTHQNTAHRSWPQALSQLPIHPLQLHASLQFSQLDHKGNSTPWSPRLVFPKCLCSSTAAPWPSPVRHPTTPGGISLCEHAGASVNSWQRHESSMPLSCIHMIESTAEIVPFCPCSTSWS